MSKKTHAIAAIAACAALSGCATTPPPNPKDPWEGFNRAMFQINDTLDTAVIRPAAVVYDTVLPSPVKTGVSNFFSNLGDLGNAANNLLQGKPQAALNDLVRFAFNSTWGLLGVLDIASEAGLPKHNEDFGQTLAVWGMGDGPYLVLPLLGGRNIRDTAALPVDYYSNPTTYVEGDAAKYSFKAANLVVKRAELLPADRATEGQIIDKYAYLRDVYFQRRSYLIHDGNPPIEYEDFNGNGSANGSGSVR
ncbi:MAG: phospholipid-binding lipoprotein MlaA [Tepidiphilus sp.]|nr:phospholipid-binding lipoprotein MlaA [Tepidiphilus sp.]